MRTAMSPKTGRAWRLCSWNEACQMPVSTQLEGRDHYCRWHARCCTYPAQAHAFEFFAEWLSGMQQAYPNDGWWSMDAELIWPVMQGVETIWIAEQKAA